ncbi:MAG: hypothetical protein WKF71_10935 [Pyrinomonadaceae bacterium]
MLFALASEKVQENKVIINENEINFCSLVDFQKNTNQKLFKQKQLYWLSHFHFYSDQCLEQDRVTALEMNYEFRTKLFEEAIK